jgi:hypothetical protein
VGCGRGDLSVPDREALKPHQEATMSLRIEMQPATDLHIDRDGKVKLPEVILDTDGAWIATLETLPRVLSEHVDGEVARRIEACFKNTYLPPVGDPAKKSFLDRKAALKAALVTVEPIRSRVRIAVTVVVQWSGSERGAPAKVQRDAVWDLIPPPPDTLASYLVSPFCRVEVETPSVLIRDGGPSVELKIKVYNRPTGAKPSLELLQPPSDAPQLLKALEQLKATPLTSEAVEGGCERWSTNLVLRLDPTAKQEMRNIAAYEVMRLLCRAVVADSIADFLLHVASAEAPFPGLLAVDFGTSGSTVTMYDPGEIPVDRGLALEQELRMRELLLARLIDEKGDCRLRRVGPADWDNLTESLNLPGPGARKLALRAAIAGDRNDMLEALRQLETHLSSSPLRRRMRRALQEIYEAAFLEPRLGSQRFVWVPVEPEAEIDESDEAESRDDGDQTQHKDISSELQIVKYSKPLTVLMGKAARKIRNEALARALAEEGGEKSHSVGSEVSFQHLRSVKRYLGSRRSFTGWLDGKWVHVSAREITQGAWNFLIEAANTWRAEHQATGGVLTRVIATYPTVATPAIRREVYEQIAELGFPIVITDYDEAVAAAFFYFHREMGGIIDLGPELFKSRAQKDNGRCFQNVLVIDIGGGSTDIALLKLTLYEVDPFEPGEDRGAGGRFYVLQPRLLGSSGSTYLGGDLITLRVFEMLKAALADRLLQAVQTGETTSEPLAKLIDKLGPEFRIDKLGPEFRIQDKRFRVGSIAQPVFEFDEAHPSRRAALAAAELVLPTHSRIPKRQQAFSVLWERAEKAKVKSLGTGLSYTMKAAEVAKILPHFQIDPRHASFDVEIPVAAFDKAAEEIIVEAIKIANGLLTHQFLHDENGQKRLKPETLDWLILSGKTWNLKLAQELLKQQFQLSRVFTWNPDRVTFDPKYAKLATSAGACYAERMRGNHPAPKQSKPDLKRGVNILSPEVANLFWFLPCSFRLDQQGSPTIFKNGQHLYRLDQDPVGKARSEPRGAPLLVTVYRQDYPEARQIPWNSFGGRELAETLELEPEAFREQMRMQYEVDHRLLMRVYLWQDDDGGLPHHFMIDPSIPALKLAAMNSQPGPGDRLAGCDVGVGAEIGLAAGHEPRILIKHDQPLKETFHLGKETLRGYIVERLDDLFRDDTLSIFTRLPNQATWARVGEVTRPGTQSESDFPPWYQVSLDDQGQLRIHFGRVPYWMTEDPRVWREEPGRILVHELDPVSAAPPPGRDPFDGTH